MPLMARLFKQFINMKTFFFCIVFVISLSLNAQITKGNWLVGGSGSFGTSYATSEDSFGNDIEGEATGLQLRPNIGYFFGNRFAAGIEVDLNFANSPGLNNSNWAAGLGPFARYYFLGVKNRINILSEANFSYGKGLSDMNKDNSSTSFGLSTGVVLFFNSSVGLEVLLNYTDTTSRSDGSANTNFKSLFITLGFQIHLEK